MSKTYTKKQIQEAISHWRAVLEESSNGCMTLKDLQEDIAAWIKDDQTWRDVKVIVNTPDEKTYTVGSFGVTDGRDGNDEAYCINCEDLLPDQQDDESLLESKKDDDSEEMEEKLPKELQKTLDKLISAEWLAGNIYSLFLTAVKKEDKDKVFSAFFETSVDEINDHLKSLVKAACDYGFDVPTSYKEFTKHADKEDVKIFENCKKGKEAEHYLKLAIELEERSIADYEKAMDIDNICRFPELQIVFKSNYYDEKEHLETFQFIKYTLDSQMDIHSAE